MKSQKKINYQLSKEQKKTEVANEENKQRPQYLLPKKKPLIAGINIKPDIDKSKFYSQKDFALAKKAVSEMKKSVKGEPIDGCVTRDSRNVERKKYGRKKWIRTKSRIVPEHR